MSKNTLIASILFSAYSYNISSIVRCACHEYPAAICYIQTYCYWTGQQCVDLQCSYLSQRKCSSPQYSEYKCKWNTNDQQCEEQTYQCSDLIQTDCVYYFQAEHHTQVKQVSFKLSLLLLIIIIFNNNQEIKSCMNCIWNSNTEQCVDFSCIDQQNCNLGKCSYQNGVCGDPLNINCSEQSTCTDTIYLGNGNICSLNDNNACTYYSNNATCNDYSDNYQLCIDDEKCTYDETNLICHQITCQFYETEFECKSIFDSQKLIYTFCLWENDTCVDASYDQFQEFFSLFPAFECLRKYTFVTWDSDAQQCKVCADLEPFPLYYMNLQTLTCLLIWFIAINYL